MNPDELLEAVIDMARDWPVHGHPLSPNQEYYLNLITQGEPDLIYVLKDMLQWAAVIGQQEIELVLHNGG